MNDPVGSKCATMALSSVGILEIDSQSWPDLFPYILNCVLFIIIFRLQHQMMKKLNLIVLLH